MFEIVLFNVRATLEVKLYTFERLFYWGNFADTLSFSQNHKNNF